MRILPAIFLSLAFAMPDPQPDVSGIYHVTSKHGKGYSGAVVINQIADGIYMVDYAVNGNHSTGVGILRGKVMSVAWRTVGGEKNAMGVTQYEFDQGHRSATGYWISGEKVSEERIRFLRKVEMDPEA